MSSYYAVCNANGPISVHLNAESESDAVTEFEAMDGHAAVDECRTDAEDDLIEDDCHAMDTIEFGKAMTKAGAKFVLWLDHDWELWVV